ncbi:Uridine phosphorylase 2 [Hypsibius exemplaris]|uniref:Uridine phosphorylase 2 n=1 Tax=Hypsibius exemplaris TaxID=2072580 RepID=A0A1W0X7W8_HYPEX|nr:Uridine phosphorylase 2 [Hypsibius exemplaris]
MDRPLHSGTSTPAEYVPTDLVDSEEDVITSLMKYQALLEKDFRGTGMDVEVLLRQFARLRAAIQRRTSDVGQIGDPSIFRVPNRYVQKARDNGETDHLYHLGLVVTADKTAEAFQDIKYVCVGGTPSRMRGFAVLCLEALQIKVPTGLGVTDLCGGHARYVMYKAGPVLTVSHGMGNPSLSIMLHEVLKLLHYAQASKDVKFIRIGTCGGVGVPGGTTVISDRVYNGIYESFYDQYILGKLVRRPASLDRKLCRDLMFHATKPGISLPVVVGNTMCADDFYEEQARIDGAFCEFSNQDRRDFMEKCYLDYGIRNFEMESLAFAAMTHHAKLRAAVVCVVIVNRLESDQIAVEVEQHLEDWTCRPQRIVAELIKHELMDSANGVDNDLQILRQELATTTDHLYPSVNFPYIIGTGNGTDSAMSSSRGESSLSLSQPVTPDEDRKVMNGRAGMMATASSLLTAGSGAFKSVEPVPVGDEVLLK